MKFFNNRKIAALVLAICVFGSIFGFGGGSLARERSSVMRVFNEGTDPSLAVRFSMDAYLDNCAAHARTMAEELRLHIDKENADAARALELADVIGTGDDLDARQAAYAELQGIVESMYTEMYAAALSDDAREIFRDAYNNFKGEADKLARDRYRDLAEDYNESLQGFPAGLIGGAVGAEPLNPF